MSTLTIPDIDDELKARLTARAAERGNTFEAEIRAILRAAVQDRAPETGLGTWIHQQFAEIGGVELDLPGRDSPVRILEFPE